MKHLIQFSGGIGSWAAAKRVIERHGTADVQLLFADTLIEDRDCYRFLIEGACNVLGVNAPTSMLDAVHKLVEPYTDIDARKRQLAEIRVQASAELPFLTWIADGRTPFDVFRSERMLGNSRFDPCSKLLKRQFIDRWKRENANPQDTICYVGIDWSEQHRLDGLVKRWQENGGWRYEAPLCDRPFLVKDDLFALCRSEGLNVPELYGLGFSHNNCGGGCIKAGHGHWSLVLRTRPELFAWWESQEESIRTQLDRDVSMLTDRRGDGRKKPLTLRSLRERIQRGEQIDLFDIGGCGCALPGA